MRSGRHFRPGLILLLTVLLPSSAVCGVCVPEGCPMMPEPEPVVAPEAPPCHQQMADQQGAKPTVALTGSMMPDCCVMAGETDAEAPAVLTPVSTGVVLVEVAVGLETPVVHETSGSDGPSPPLPHQPLYHLHSSLLI